MALSLHLERALAFATPLLAITIVVLDGAMVGVALPFIASGYGVAPEAAIWAIMAYQITVVALLLPLAALAETIGFRVVFVVGVAVFFLAAFACASAMNLSALIFWRVVQGIGGSAIMSINAAMIRQIMPRDRLGRAIGIQAAAVAMAAALGPMVGAMILAFASWRWIFLLYLPVCLLVFALGTSMLPRVPGRGNRFDLLSGVLNTAAFGSLISALGLMARPGMMAVSVGLGITGALALAVLVRRQWQVQAPIIPFDLLGKSIFTLAIAASISSFVAQFMVLIALPFYFNGVLGRSPIEIGLLMTPWPVAIACLSPVATRLADRWGDNAASVAGSLLFAAGLVLLAVLGEEPANIHIVLCLVLCGMGVGLFHAPNVRSIVMSSPSERSGAASGMQSTGRVIGQSIGAALAGALIGSGLYFGFGTLFAIAAGFSVAAGMLSLKWRR